MSGTPLKPAHAPTISRILRDHRIPAGVHRAGFGSVSVSLAPGLVQGAQTLLFRYGYSCSQPTKQCEGVDWFFVQGKMDC